MTVSIKELLEAGVHFGHQTKRWNPKMARYIFCERSGIYIINLEQTEQALQKACEFLMQVVARGEYVLFVGTKKQAQQTIVDEAGRCGMFYVNQRWLGGTLTNFETIRKSIKRLDQLERMRDDGTFAKLKKKEVAVLTQEMNKLLKNLGGIRTMGTLPGALFVIDAKKEETAVREARRLNIPVIGLVDTNSDPDVIDYVIPGNDDAIKSIQLVCAAVANAICEGKSKFDKSRKRAEAQAAAIASDVAPLVEAIEEKVIGAVDVVKRPLPKTKRELEDAAKKRVVRKRKAE